MATINLAEYQYTLKLDDSQYTQSMTQAENTAEGMKMKMSNVGDYLKTGLVAGLAAAGIAVAGFVKSGIENAADLETQMSKFQASTGATADEVAKVHEIAKELYKTNTDSMEDIVATSSAMMTQLGLTADEIGTLQQTIMDFAKTTGQSNTDVVASVDDIGDAWGMTAEQSVAYLDVIKRSSEEYGTDIAQVTTALSNCAPAAKALGLSFEETNGIMNLFAASGLDASQATTALTYAAKQVESPEAFRKMLSDIQAITDPTERAQAAVELFGSRAGVALANAFDDTKSLDDFVLSLDECAGAVANASAAFDNNFATQSELFKKQLSGIGIEIGETLLPILNKIMSFVSSNIPKISSIVNSTISAVSKTIKPVITLLGTLFDELSNGKDKTDSVFTSIAKIIKSVFNTITSVVRSFVALFSQMWDAWGKDLFKTAKTQFAYISNAIQSTLDVIQNVVKVFTSVLQGDWSGAFTALKKIASSGWEAIKNIFAAVVTPIKNVLNTIISAITTWVSNMIAKAREAATNFLNNITNGIAALPSNVATTLTNALNNVVTWATNLAQKATSAASTFLLNIVYGISALPSNMATTLNNAINNVISWASNLGMQATSAAAGFLNNVISGIVNLPMRISETLSNAITTVMTWASNMVQQASTTASNFVNTVLYGISNLPTNVYNKLSGVVGTITSWGSNLWNAASGAASKIVSGVVNTISSLPNQVYSIGSNIVQGIWNGINGNLQWIKNKISGWVGNVTSFLKKLFGIHSPSTVMRDEVGKYLAQGIGVGFQDEIGNVNKMIADSIQTEYKIGTDVLAGVHNTPAYKTATAAVSAGNSSFSYSTGDIIINGNADRETIQDLEQLLYKHGAAIQSIVFNANTSEASDFVNRRIDRRGAERVAAHLLPGY